MEVSYELTTGELSRAARAALLRKPMYRILIGFGLVVWLGAFALLAAAARITPHGSPASASAMGGAVSTLLIFAAIVLGAFFLLTRVTGPRPQSVQIGPEGLVVTRPQGRFETPWTGIQGIKQTREGLVLVPKATLWTASGPRARLDVIMIPERAFADVTAASAFETAVAGFWKAAVKTSKAGTPGVWPPPPR